MGGCTTRSYICADHKSGAAALANKTAMLTEADVTAKYSTTGSESA